MTASWMKNISLLIFFVLAGSATLLSQNTDARLAAQYYRDGEYEKASVLYKRLYSQRNFNFYYFDKYTECLLNLERYEECEQAIKKESKKNPKDVQLLVAYGNLMERQFRDEEAQKKYEEAINRVGDSRNDIVKLANAFMGDTKYELAIQTYEKGAKALKDPQVFAYNLGDLYRRKGDVPKMVENYLQSLAINPSRLDNLKRLFSRGMEEEGLNELQKQLYAFIQSSNDNIQFLDLLAWVFIQKEDYKSALRQVKALDRRLEEAGQRVYDLAESAAVSGDYDAAIDGFQYIIDEKGKDSPFYIDAKRESLICRRDKLVKGYDYTRADLENLRAQYEEFLSEFGRNRSTAGIIGELADLEALYLNNLDKAIELLNEMIELPGVDRIERAEAKITLADYYLMKGERWESTLLYSQVDKEFKDDILGHEARFRNAKLSYYVGDFQWAQAQFDVLKASTSKLIANDALDLSIFIMDNLGLDTTAESLSLYADADLLIFQNKFDDAFQAFDRLLKDFPDHSLLDDVLYSKAKVYRKQRQYEKAVEMYQKIIDNHRDEIRADNALFELADLYEHELNQQEKAKPLYETLFIDFSNSTFAVEARKRYRILRGDNIE